MSVDMKLEPAPISLLGSDDGRRLSASMLHGATQRLEAIR